MTKENIVTILPFEWTAEENMLSPSVFVRCFMRTILVDVEVKTTNHQRRKLLAR